jgi:hypothetical protein
VKKGSVAEDGKTGEDGESDEILDDSIANTRYGTQAPLLAAIWPTPVTDLRLPERRGKLRTAKNSPKTDEQNAILATGVKNRLHNAGKCRKTATIHPHTSMRQAAILTAPRMYPSFVEAIE